MHVMSSRWVTCYLNSVPYPITNVHGFHIFLLQGTEDAGLFSVSFGDIIIMYAIFTSCSLWCPFLFQLRSVGIGGYVIMLVPVAYIMSLIRIPLVLS